MVMVEIRGKQFPLCLTVAALDEINAKCGGIDGIGKFLDGINDEGKRDLNQSVCNTAWMLSLLIQEGEENRLVCARCDGEKAERRAVPDASAIGHLLTVASAIKYKMVVVAAVNESLTQEIEAANPKNAKSAE